jgi:hypothetical protein
MNIYYVYAYLRKNSFTPYYIGKGKGRRAWQRHKNVKTPDSSSHIVLLETNLTEVGALAIERRMIRWYGQEIDNTGILQNKTKGGDGCRGFSNKGQVPWNKGKSYKELYDPEKEKEIKSVQSHRSSGTNNPMYGKHHKDESKKKMSEKKFGYKPWITGKKLPGIFKRFNRRGINNAYIKYVLK